MSFENIGKRETLPEKVYKTIKESILKGELKGGDILPTEPELEKQFGVSRAVIRDAIRMLKAQGLIDVKHGKGMYVSHSQIEAFTDALLITLRRDNASAWDVEQFEQIFMPQVLSVAAVEATEEDILIIKAKAEENMESYIAMVQAEKTKNQILIDKATEKARVAFKAFMISIFNSTHNKMISLIGEVLISMRKWRSISDVDADVNDFINIEQKMINKFVKAIEQRDPEKAAAFFKEGIHYSQSIIDIMKNTPVGTSPEIPGDLFFQAFKDLN